MRLAPGVTLASACTILIASLVGCGGGVSDNTEFLPVFMSGTAATGMPIIGATVDVLCSSGEKKTTKTRSDGRYSVDISGCTAPFVVTVSGTVGDTQDTLVSVNPSNPPAPIKCVNGVCPAVAQIFNTHVTPITHAIAALVASTGDPFDLVTNFATQKSGISASAVSEARSAMTTALANVMTAAGIKAPPGAAPDPASFPASLFLDPISWILVADGTGWDRVLDNVKFEVSAAGITMTNIAVGRIDDMAAIPNGSAPPSLPAGSQIVFNRTNFKTALATPMPAAADDLRAINAVRDAANACFAAPAAQRGTFASPGSACANLATSDYLNDGKSGSQEFDRFLTDPKMDGAKFNPPEVLRFFSSQRVLLDLSAVQTDGVVISWRSVAENSAATGDTWKLRGNQRPYFMSVNGVAERRIQLPRAGATPSSYTSGLNLYFDSAAGGANDATPGTATGVSYVLVKGPGLPSAGQILRPGPSGCNQYFVVAASPPPAPLPATQACTSYLKLASRALDGSSPDPNSSAFGSSPDFAPAPVSDTDIIATIQPMSAYTFEVHQANGTVLTFVERLRGRPPTLQNMDSVRWNVLSDATQAAMVPGSAQSFAGGSFTVAWVPQANTPPVMNAQVQIRTSAASAVVRDRQDVAVSASTATLTNGGAGFPASSNEAEGYQFVQLGSRTQSDMQILSSWAY